MVSSTPATELASTQDPTFSWLLGWLLFIILLVLLSRTTLGHMLVYYGLLLVLIFLLVTQYKFIAATLGQVGKPESNLPPGATHGASGNF